MRAFVFYVNGKKVCTAGIGGAGVIATHLDMVRGVARKSGSKAPEEVTLHVGGLFSRSHTHATWLHRELQVGDSIRVDIVEVSRVDRPQKKRTENVRSRMKREQEFVLKKAASWGWKLQKR